VAELAVSTLQAMSKKKEPFFLAVGFIKPHLRSFPEEILGPLRSREDPARPQQIPPQGRARLRHLPGGELRNYHGIPAESIPDDLARSLSTATTPRSATWMHKSAKCSTNWIASPPQDTIIILWGDHGWKLGEHDAWCKHSNVENDVNVRCSSRCPA